MGKPAQQSGGKSLGSRWESQAPDGPAGSPSESRNTSPSPSPLLKWLFLPRFPRLVAGTTQTLMWGQVGEAPDLFEKVNSGLARLGREVTHCQGCTAKVISGLKSNLGSPRQGCCLAWDRVHPEEGTPFPNLYEGVLRSGRSTGERSGGCRALRLFSAECEQRDDSSKLGVLWGWGEWRVTHLDEARGAPWIQGCLTWVLKDKALAKSRKE